MAAKITSNFQLSTQIDLNKITKKTSGINKLPQRFSKRERLQIPVSAFMKQRRSVKRNSLIMRSSQNYQASALEIGNLPASAFDEVLLLKNKSEEIEPYLRDRCIYLVGMMGSGKTTIGRIMAEVLGYSFRDCDKLIEQATGGIIVADIFKLYGETFFRNNETEVLKEMSARQRLVISTGGGAVVRPINWKYMHKGITVWLDVPLEALARRITACGTDSRPLLHLGDGDAYTRTLKHLNTLWEDRSEAYTNADARVSLEHIAAKLGYKDVCNITPTEIAFEALLQIDSFVRK